MADEEDGAAFVEVADAAGENLAGAEAKRQLHGDGDGDGVSGIGHLEGGVEEAAGLIGGELKLAGGEATRFADFAEGGGLMADNGSAMRATETQQTWAELEYNRQSSRRPSRLPSIDFSMAPRSVPAA